MTDLSLDTLRFRAKLLHRAFIAREPWALEQLAQYPPRKSHDRLARADFLHITAQQQGFASWPQMKAASDAQGLDRATALQRLKIAMARGQNGIAHALLEEWPDLAQGVFGLNCALYDVASVRVALGKDPELAVRKAGPRSPILHLAFSKWIHAHPELQRDMLDIAELLLANGADVNDGAAVSPEDPHQLSALYGALGHANNMVLAQWLLDHGADPDDGESLYHATELGHHEGLRMLLQAGANPRGTNALLRALDFNDHGAVRLLIDHGANVNEFSAKEVGGEAPWVIPALHQAARRGCDAEMVELLLEAGADPSQTFEGASVYSFAKVFGHQPLAQAIEKRGLETPISTQERLLVAAAEGAPISEKMDPAALPKAYAHLLHQLLALPDRLPQIRRLIEVGMPSDTPDTQVLTPVQIAGWEGLAEEMAYFLSLNPNLGHINGYGGTLLSTILHGAENCPRAEVRDHGHCLTLALSAGLKFPKAQLGLIARDDLVALLKEWDEEHPGTLV